MTSWNPTRRSFPTATRRAILARARGHCQACGQPSSNLEADHIIPDAEGGGIDLANGAALCPTCHQAKTEREKARGRARKSPRRLPEKHPGIR